MLVVSTLPLEVYKAGRGNVSSANKEWESDQIISRWLKFGLVLYFRYPPLQQFIYSAKKINYVC